MSLGFNHIGKIMSSEKDPNECPFCHATSDCLHLLLIVDKTFRTADGGPLRKAFNSRWYAICVEQTKDDEDFDESEPFENLIEEVDSLSDATNGYDHEGGPGCSSEYQLFFCETQEKIKAAILSFEAT